MSPLLSIVIVSWNALDELRACLAALPAACAGLSYDVTVVDNASCDGTVDVVRGQFPGVCVIANSGNVGFARASNQGIRASAGEFALLLNPDCGLAAGACTAMVRYLEAHPQAAAVGPRLLRPDGTDDVRNPRRLPTLWSDFCDRSGLAAAWPRSRLFAGGYLPRFDRSGEGSVESLSGACLMLRRSAVQQIGLLDEDFALFGEDADLCLRLRRAGWELHYLGAATAVHVGGASTSRARDRSALLALASRQRFFRKHYGAGYALLHRFLNGALAAGKLAALAPAALWLPVARPRLRRQWRLLCWCVRGDAVRAPDSDVGTARP